MILNNAVHVAAFYLLHSLEIDGDVVCVTDYDVIAMTT
jgi:hypothetical protein